MDDVTENLTSLEPGTLFAGYRIEGILDRGGMGVVYKAADEELDRTVALKIIAPEHTQNPDAVTRFKSEARLAASLEHPNIVPIHRGGEYHGVLYLAMRFVPGTNLRQVIDQSQLDLDRVQRVMRSVASALDAAHERGLVHRDVKPANILISGEGDREHVYLTDFGLTKQLGSPGSLTRTGAWVGTPDYVAPEQIQAGPVDGRADVYSLGCVLYEMLTGAVAYPKDNDMAKLWAHVQDPPPSPSLSRPELIKAFDDVVARATAKNPNDRYAKASEVAAAVDNAITEQSSQLGPGALQATRAAEAAAPSFERHDVFIAEPTQGPAQAPVPSADQGTAPPAGPSAAPGPSADQGTAPAAGPAQRPSGPARTERPRRPTAGWSPQPAHPARRCRSPSRPRCRRGRPARRWRWGRRELHSGRRRPRRHNPSRRPGVAADRRPSVPAPVRGRDGGRRQADRHRRHRREAVLHHHQDLRPRHGQLVNRPRPAACAAPLLGRELRGRGGCDRRLHSGRGADLGAVGPRVRPAWGHVGGAALAEPPACRGGRCSGGGQDRGRRRPGGRQAGAADGGVRRRALDRRGGAPNAA